jgi:DNA mismatch repair ATPase MutS
LEEHTSSFYAELKRIRQLLDIVKKEPSIFFLVDEILKGTNSEDRHIGAVALANQLSRKNTFGIISTHDLKLSEVANENDNVRNFSFNSEIVGDKISFDYKLTQGVCKSFNASQLMRNMGILID